VQVQDLKTDIFRYMAYLILAYTSFALTLFHVNESKLLHGYMIIDYKKTLEDNYISWGMLGHLN
jgi:hypothetical protein